MPHCSPASMDFVPHLIFVGGVTFLDHSITMERFLLSVLDCFRSEI